MTDGDGTSDAPAATGKPDRAGIVIAVVLAAVAGIIFRDAAELHSNTVYGLGPQAMPIAVATGLALLAIGNLVNALRGSLPPRESADPKSVLLILGGLALMIAIIGFGGGFILAETALFVATSAAFGRRALIVDTLIALVINTLIYLAFDRLLTLTLPTGPLERLL
jgi:putative tricarboxylic transport membrane protein